MWLRDACFVIEETEPCAGDQDTCVCIATDKPLENCFYFPDASCPNNRVRNGNALVSLSGDILRLSVRTVSLLHII